jgi:hypothetical protein
MKNNIWRHMEASILTEVLNTVSLIYISVVQQTGKLYINAPSTRYPVNGPKRVPELEV